MGKVKSQISRASQKLFFPPAAEEKRESGGNRKGRQSLRTLNAMTGLRKTLQA